MFVNMLKVFPKHKIADILKMDDKRLNICGRKLKIVCIIYCLLFMRFWKGNFKPTFHAGFFLRLISYYFSHFSLILYKKRNIKRPHYLFYYVHFSLIIKSFPFISLLNVYSLKRDKNRPPLFIIFFHIFCVMIYN